MGYRLEQIGLHLGIGWHAYSFMLVRAGENRRRLRLGEALFIMYMPDFINVKLSLLQGYLGERNFPISVNRKPILSSYEILEEISKKLALRYARIVIVQVSCKINIGE